MDTLQYLKEKYNLDFNGKMPLEIPNVGRLDLLRWLRELDFKVGAEIGVASGEFSKLICLTNPQITLYGVDPWHFHDEYREYKGQKDLDNLYQHTRQLMKAYMRDGNYHIIKKPSLDALADFADESLDFVYIDANHEAPYVQQDIEGWAKKVRKGGIVAGHDYIRVKVLNFAIKDALMDYTRAQGITPWFVLGSSEMVAGQVRDRVRSWAFVK